MKEFDLIRVVSEVFCYDDLEVPVTFHDASYIKLQDKYLVLTCDTVNELSDFPKFMLPEEMGHMALAVTLSDLAACGAKPLYFLNSISLKKPDLEFFKRILIGMKKLAEKYGVKVVGGDIDFCEYLVISGFAIGETDKIITRSNAREGEKVYITGLLGKAQLCLEMLEKGYSKEDLPYAKSLYTPEPKIYEGLKISKFASTLTDISDSLAISLHQISEQSGVKIVLDDIPLEHLTEFVDEEKALELFLYGGGDFELVFTAESSDIGIEIGRVEKGRGVFLKDRKVEFRGYTHF